MTAQDAIDRYCEELDEYIQNAYWEANASENRMQELLEQCAAKDGLTIDWKHGDGRLVYGVYADSEKGLS